MSTGSNEERELSLVNKVELRIALTETDGKLSALLKTYLGPLLLKLASEHLSVRNKVISVCQHITTRLQSPNVELPVATLLKQFKEQDAKLVRHFDLLYAQQGFKRLSGREKNELVPDLIKGISQVIKDPKDQSEAQFFNLFLQALHHYEFPRKGSKEEDGLRQTLELSEEDASTLATWFQKLILLEIGQAASTYAASGGLPGITEDEQRFLNVYSRPGVWDPSVAGGLRLKNTKLLVLKLLSTGAFNDDERFMPALFASAHRDSNVADAGEDLLKHAIADVKLDDTNFIKRLYDAYLGSEGRAPASSPLQAKILGVLQRSTISASFSSQCLRIVELGISNEAGGPQGREAAKLQTVVFTFANYFFRHGDKEDLKRLTPSIIQSMQHFIQVQGWPAPETSQDLSLRRNAYELIGTCAKAGELQDIALLDWLFESLRDDQSGRDTSLAIEHALAMMIDTFSFIYQAASNDQNADGDTEMADHGGKATVEDLSKLLHQHMLSQEIDSPRRSTRYIATRFANRCLPYSNTVGRWVDILAAGGAPGEKMEVVEEGKKGLDPFWFSTLNSDRKDLWAKQATDNADLDISFPVFADLYKQVFLAKQTRNTWDMELEGSGHLSEIVSHFMQHTPYAIETAVTYCWRTFVHEALERKCSTITINAEWERKIQMGTTQDLDIRKAVQNYAAEIVSKQSEEDRFAFLSFVGLCFEIFVWQDGKHAEGVREIIAQVLSICPKGFVNSLAVAFDINRLTPLIHSNQQHIREIAAQTFGILASYSHKENISTTLEGLLKPILEWKSAIGARINQVNGSIRAIAFAASRMKHQGLTSDLFAQGLRAMDGIVLDILKTSNDSTLLDAAYASIDQLSIFNVYGSLLELEDEKSETIIKILSEHAEKGNEKAIKALGRFGLNFTDSVGEEASLKKLEAKLYKLHELRESNTQFTVGEALCCAACGWDNTALQLDLDIDAPVPVNEKKHALSQIFQRTIKDCKASKPSLRKASVIWLLCLVQFCGHLPEVKGQLRACQAAFGSSLSDRDDLVQEAASRGLGIVYQKGDKGLRDDLVRDLMRSFSSDKSNLAGNVDEETTLFDPGALRTGDGDSSITTYKDILSLASEIGNPGLVYQFMSLAANNAIWTNRAAFANSGLRNILSDSSVGGYLAENPKLYTKLFRYRFDPNSNVQRSMTDIWNSLVKDSNATVEKYFDPIMDDLLQNILTKEWRVRQACCDAISDLVQGRQLKQYEKYLTDVWTKCFRVLDDIKETVRVAAGRLARVLSQILVRSLEAGEASAKSAETMLKHVLPFLLSGSGLESSAEDVQMFSLSTILDIVKKGTPRALRPFIPDLVERILALFTDLEPATVNYLHLNASKYKITEEKLDAARLSAVRGSPLMEALDRSFDLMDKETMERTAVSIERAMKAAVGLPSKLACGNALVSLSLRHRELFKPHVGRFLKLLEKAVLDRNETASSTYAAACGYLAKLASDKQILKLVDYSKKLYLEDEDEKHRVTSADVIRAISKQVPDRLSSLASDILPFVYISKHDGQDAIKDLNTKTWEDNVGTLAVSLYLREIMTTSLELLDSPRWNLKHTAARTIADATSSLATGYDGITEDQAIVIWPSLKKALEGKTWEGKEVVVKAFAAFVEKSKGDDFREKITADVIKISLREAKRQNKDYQQYAIPTLGKVSASFSTAEKVDWYKEISSIVNPILEDVISTYTDKMDVDGRDAYLEDKKREKTICGCIEALQQSFNPLNSSVSPSDTNERLIATVKLFTHAMTVRMRGVEKSVFTSLEGLYKKLDTHAVLKLESCDHKPLAQAVLDGLFEKDVHGHMESVRLERANALLALSRVPWPALVSEVIDPAKIDVEIGKEPSKAVADVLREARSKIT